MIVSHPQEADAHLHAQYAARFCSPKRLADQSGNKLNHPQTNPNQCCLGIQLVAVQDQWLLGILMSMKNYLSEAIYWVTYDKHAREIFSGKRNTVDKNMRCIAIDTKYD